MIKSFSFSEVVKKAWELTKANFWFLLGLGAIVYILPSIATNILIQMGLGRSLTSLLSQIYSIIVSLGAIKISLNLVDGKKVDYQQLWSETDKFVNYFVASILYGLMVGIGLVLLVVPGIYLGLKYQYTLYLIVDKNMGIMDAFKESANITNGKLMDLFWLGLGMFGIMMLGVLALFVGVFVAAPVAMLGYAYVYRQLSTKK